MNSQLTIIANSLKHIENLSTETNGRLQSLELRFEKLTTQIGTTAKIYTGLGAILIGFVGWMSLQIYDFNASIAAIKAHLGIN